jgi:hypothetical protein
MADVDSAAEFDPSQRQRERHGGKRDQHQDPECIHVGEEGRLDLHLLSDPLDGLIMRLRRVVLGSSSQRAKTAA